VIPEAVDLSVNARVLGFTLVVGVGSGLLFGLAPVVQALRRNTTVALRAGGGAVLGAAGLIAAVIPALRAIRVDPIVALREP
jgi:ABC-type antimicrobial peptide transport system permease subunit